MAKQGLTRKLAAILAADVAGYTRLMEADEDATLAAWWTARKEIIDPQIVEHGGRIVKHTGDGFLAEFATASEAVRCAVAMQSALASRNVEVAGDRRFDFRMGINIGEIVVDDEDIYGDGVNIAARIESLAEPGSVWISGSVYEQVHKKLDLAFEDKGEQTVKNITEPIRAYSVPLGEGDLARPKISELGDKPVIAVLPFTNMGGDPDQEYFSDGLTEDIITTVSAWRSFPVIARSSTFAYKGQSPDVRQVADELGARYVLEGSVRKAGNRVRISAQLIDADTGHHVWAEKFDRELEDIFVLQDEIAQRIAATVEPELHRAEHKRLVAKKPENLDAWDYYQRGMSLLHAFTKDGNAGAREMFQRALELDPTYSQAYSGLAQSHHRDINLDFSESRKDSAAQCLEAARQAVALDDTDSSAHWVLGLAFQWSGQHELAVAEEERAVELNPSSAQAHVSLGTALAFAGRPEEGIPYIEKALQLNPQDPRSYLFTAILARTHLNAGNYEAAVELARKAIHRKSDHLLAHIYLAASLGHMGRRAEARAALDECERIQPGFVEKRAGWQPYRDPADHEHILDGLRKAGLQE